MIPSWLVEFSPESRFCTLAPTVTYGEVQAWLASQGFSLACGGQAYPEGTPLIEILNWNWPVCRQARDRFVYPADWTLGLTLTTPAGDPAPVGGKVLKNVTGYDVVRLVLGAGGSLGPIASATLRVEALQPEHQGTAALTPDLVTTLSDQHWTELGLTRVAISHEAHPPWLVASWRTDAPTSWLQTTFSQPAMVAHNEALYHPALWYDLPEGDVLLETAFSQGVAWTLPEFEADLTPVLSWPAQGLGWWRVPAKVLSALPPSVEENLIQWGGVRLVAASPSIPPAQLEALAEFWNLPTDPVHRQVLAQLKRAMDPEGQWQTPLYPLHRLLSSSSSPLP